MPNKNGFSSVIICRRLPNESRRWFTKVIRKHYLSSKFALYFLLFFFLDSVYADSPIENFNRKPWIKFRAQWTSFSLILISQIVTKSWTKLPALQDRRSIILYLYVVIDGVEIFHFFSFLNLPRIQQSTLGSISQIDSQNYEIDFLWTFK